MKTVRFSDFGCLMVPLSWYEEEPVVTQGFELISPAQRCSARRGFPLLCRKTLLSEDQRINTVLTRFVLYHQYQSLLVIWEV